MKLSVTQNKVEIIEKGIVNQGEYQVTECEFDFVGAYDNLVKKAIFTDKTTGKAYEMPILDNACAIPAEILQNKGICLIGVYAYDTFEDNDELALRYSPTPATVTIESGSYRADVENPSNITASQAEQYESKINTKIAEVDAVVEEVKEKLSKGEFKGEKGEDGEKGEKGETGENGKNGVDGKDGADGKSAYDVAVANGYSGSEAEWIESLNGTNGRDGADGQDGINGTDGKDGQSAYALAIANGFAGTETEWLESLHGTDGKDGVNGANGTNGKDGEDGYSPTVTLEQLDDTTAQLTITKKDGSTQSVKFGGLWEDAEEEKY